MTGNIVPELLGPAWSTDDDDDDVILQNGLCWDNFMIKHFFQMPLGLGRHLLVSLSVDPKHSQERPDSHVVICMDFQHDFMVPSGPRHGDMGEVIVHKAIREISHC